MTAAATPKPKYKSRKPSEMARGALVAAAETMNASAGADPAEKRPKKTKREPIDRLQLIEEHQGAWTNIYDLREDAYRILRGEMPKHMAPPNLEDIVDENGKVLEKAERMTMTRRLSWAAKIIAIFEADSRAMMMAQEGERRAYGFDYKTQMQDGNVDENALRERRELARSVIERVQTLKQLAAPQPPTSPPETPPQEKAA